MVARMEELVKRLDPRPGLTDDEQIKLVKLCYIKLGAVPRVLQLLASTDGADNLSNSLRVQCAATVGSFTCVPDGVTAVVNGNGVSHLLQTLTSSDEALVTAGARSLKLLCQVEAFPYVSAGLCHHCGCWSECTSLVLRTRGKGLVVVRATARCLCILLLTSNDPCYSLQKHTNVYNFRMKQ